MGQPGVQKLWFSTSSAGGFKGQAGPAAVAVQLLLPQTSGFGACHVHGRGGKNPKAAPFCPYSPYNWLNPCSLFDRFVPQR